MFGLRFLALSTPLATLFATLLFSSASLAAQAGLGSVQPAPSSGTPDYSLEVVPITAGQFRMGSTQGNRDERPVREVTVGGFALGRNEVTVGWYLRCMADSACDAPSWWSKGYAEEAPAGLTNAERMRLPITGISWVQAKAFCRWLGPGYDLPTEAEWEYAAGAGRNWKYPWGDKPADRYRDAGIQKRLKPVGSFAPSPLGLHDLAGGVWEWVDDCYRPKAPKKGGEGCAYRVTKGGSWSEHTWNLRVANKSFGLESEGYKGLGFRVAYHAP